MLHFGRCGSTVLATMLSQHPDVTWDGELFEMYRVGQLNKPDLPKDPWIS